MLHVVAFLVIGIVVGYTLARSATGSALAIRIISALIGSFLGGEIGLLLFGKTSLLGKYGSIIYAIVLAGIISLLIPKPKSTPTE
ncbi:MAG: hypothetical protein ACP5OR_00425 [Candidatus Dormibacteria bacterium]